MKVSAILLAAGLSRRMRGQDKLLLPFKGKILLQRAVDLLESLPVYEKILVTASARLELITMTPAIRVVINHHPEKGQSESLRLGVKAASGDAYFFLAADQPRLTLSSLYPVLELAKANADKIIYPAVNGNPCSPVLFPALFRSELLGLSGDTGGRTIRDAHPDACMAYDSEFPEDFIDIDCLEDWKKML